ncbi:MAG: NADH-quinone oxidoreductase subunit M [Fibrobacteria bacterium]|nr:NADH-quinone oxidoreductase subunit M [Fibrobacteria bacterium]
MNLHLAVIAPLIAALLAMFSSGKDASQALRNALLLALAILGISAPLLSGGIQSTEPLTWFVLPAVGTRLRWFLATDGLSSWLVVLSALLVPAALVLGRRMAGDRMREFASLVFLMQAFMAGAVLAADLFLFYGFFEAMLLPATLLIALFGGRDRRKAATLFVVFSLVGSVPLFVSIWWLATLAPYHVASLTQSAVQLEGTLGFTELQALLAQVSPAARGWIFASFALAFLVKLPVAGLHVWQAEAYAEGPAASSALLTGVMAKVGLYGFLRILIPLFPMEAARYSGAFMVLGVVTVLVGAFLALQQTEIRRVLAFSSLSHLGLGIAALFTFRAEAQAGVVLLIVAHGLSAATLFLLAGVAESWMDSTHVDDFGALSRQSPVFAVLFALAALASVGLPGTAGFVAEFLMLLALFKGASIWLVALAGSAVILSVAYTLRLVQKLLFGKAALAEPAQPRDLHLSEGLVLAPLLLLLVVLGFYPAPVLSAARSDLLQRLPLAQAVSEDASHAAGR